MPMDLRTRIDRIAWQAELAAIPKRLSMVYMRNKFDSSLKGPGYEANLIPATSKTPYVMQDRPSSTGHAHAERYQSCDMLVN